jgi:hypothetical protein
MCGAVETEGTALSFPFGVTDLIRNVYEHKQKCAEETQQNVPRHSFRRDEVRIDCG